MEGKDGKNITLNTKTVLLKDTIQNILRKSPNKRKGIDMKLYRVDGTSDKDAQTVVNFLTSMDNPDNEYKKASMHVDNLLSEALDKVLLSDKVKSCNDYYKVNSKKDFVAKMSVEEYDDECKQ